MHCIVLDYYSLVVTIFPIVEMGFNLGIGLMSVIILYTWGTTTYREITDVLKQSTSLTCMASTCRSGLAVFVTCTEDPECRAVWTNRTEKGQLQCMVCSCMQHPDLRTEFVSLESHIHIRDRTSLNKSMPIDLIHQSHKAHVPYPTMHHSEQKCTPFCSE